MQHFGAVWSIIFNGVIVQKEVALSTPDGKGNYWFMQYPQLIACQGVALN